ncbi:phage tail tube protein [Clostridium tagluense]|uniref:phage tail tube protein n=1 Tax=Clostridium tagluense TaxID=360422 RepID=UPI001C6E45D0|nr:phage tail tube protein [Clostridium tagluense]MBW9154860.1 phage tail tube protein [Clostridium tagluense]WLC64315.1 phage tail tube protein [Clostridium tagluense]
MGNSASNNYWTGNGNLWLEDKEFEKVKSFECKAVYEWEDVPNGLTTDRVLMGISYEGSFSYRKTDKNFNIILDLIFAEYAKGNVPEVNIVSKAYNKASGKTQRIKITNITFDELMLQKWEEKSVTEGEMPFKASFVEIL